MKLFNNMFFQGFTQLALLAMMSLPGLVQAEPPLDIATTPLANSGGAALIKPNMLYVLDDSGSMGWDYMPDWTNGASADLHNDASYNAVAYNPAVRYDPPAYYTTAGAVDTTTYPSQSGMSGATGANSQTKPNWRAVSSNAYTGGGDTNLENLNGGAGPQYTVSIANEYCTRTDLRICVSQETPTATHPYPARIRWCNSAAVASGAALPADNACQSVRTGAFTNMRVPASPPVAGVYSATVTFTSASSKPRVNQITVNGQRIMRKETKKTNNLNTTAQRVVDEINDCTSRTRGECDVAGFYATRSGSRVTIYSPSAVSGSPSVSTGSGTLNNTVTPFFNPNASTTAGRVTVSITPSTTAYPYPGETTSDVARTDCATAVCTYVEEMENYANWYTYYRTRMQMMKTSTSLAFKDVGDDFRMGLMTINANEALDFADFTGSAKATWYRILFSVVPGGGTPLREALANAGRIYANKYNQNGVFSDPVQYECQDNFTLLTTDGKWNSGAGVRLDNSAMTNQDSDPSEKGKYEGANASSDTLADVAKYYRDTDLRTAALGNCTGALGSGVCETTGVTPAPNQKQSMVTFTLGLGVDGTLAYDVDYGPTVPGDFKSIYDGNLQWPRPISNNENTFDDLWHAAVNGDGRYFSAKKTQDLIDQLREAIALIKVKTGAGTAAATSTLNPIAGDNFAYLASYTSSLWTGNLEKREIDLTTGAIQRTALACVEDVVPDNNCSSPSVVQPDGAGGYSCVTTGVTDPSTCTGDMVGTECRVAVLPSCFSTLKDQVATDTRTIYFNQNDDASLDSFVFSNLSVAQTANFAASFLTAQLTQGGYTTEQLVNLTGDNLVNYLKGDNTFEQNAALVANQLFRKRTAVLGDLIGSKPSFVGKPTFNYGDAGYQEYKVAQSARAGTVYVGSNDGMLHAFEADTLIERWAYVPSVVIPNLWKLADSNYSAKHSYYVDGDVTISDICVATDCTKATASDWRTILVGGLDGGGRGYYALDITTPTAPKLLWEIDPSDSDFAKLGYTYGNPIITKREGDGKWVVLFASGYNNIPDNDAFYSSTASTNFKPNLTPQFTTGDGEGYLYVVDAEKGTRLAEIATGVGSTTSPSGLAKISAFAEKGQVNNITAYVYGGDLDGNVWRFNITKGVDSVLHFAKLKDAAGKNQPIMTAPELGKVDKKRVVYVGTGKYLETTDLDAAGFTLQSLYALKDVANDTDPGPVIANARAEGGIVNQTVVPHPDPLKFDERVSGTSRRVDFKTGPGWYIDFPDSGERQNIASQLVLGTLLVPTIVPTASACQPAGYGWFNFFDAKTGLAVLNASGSVSHRLSSPSAGFNTIFINGKPVVNNIGVDGEDGVIEPSFDLVSGGFRTIRSIWRELVDE